LPNPQPSLLDPAHKHQASLSIQPKFPEHITPFPQAQEPSEISLKAASLKEPWRVQRPHNTVVARSLRKKTKRRTKWQVKEEEEEGAERKEVRRHVVKLLFNHL